MKLVLDAAFKQLRQGVAGAEIDQARPVMAAAVHLDQDPRPAPAGSACLIDRAGGSGSARFVSVMLNNAGQNGYLEIQSRSGFIESIRRSMAARALGRGASPAEAAHLCGASMRTIQRLQRAGAS